MNNPKVAVVIPCYNSGRYLAQTLDSVWAQTYSDYVIIAVDDGSTDNTHEILMSCAERITILTHADGKNHGQSATLNLGLLHTDLEYIAFLDNDDIWLPGKLQQQVDILDSHQDVGLVYTNGYVIDDNGKRRYPLFAKDHQEKNAIGDILLNNYIRSPSLVMVRKSVLQTVGTFTVGIIPDQDMWVRISEVSQLYYLDEPLVCYREHLMQLSQTNNKKMWKDALWVLESALQRYPYPWWIKRKRLAVIHYRLGKHSMKVKAYFKAITHLIFSCCYDPVRAFKHTVESR